MNDSLLRNLGLRADALLYLVGPSRTNPLAPPGWYSTQRYVESDLGLCLRVVSFVRMKIEFCMWNKENTCGRHEAMSIVSPWGPRMPASENSESVLITPATFGQNSVSQSNTKHWKEVLYTKYKFRWRALHIEFARRNFRFPLVEPRLGRLIEGVRGPGTGSKPCHLNDCKYKFRQLEPKCCSEPFFPTPIPTNQFSSSH